MVAAEIMGGLSGLKAAFDIAKGLKDIDDATRRNAAVIELQEKILAARETHSALLDRVGGLEEKVAGFEKWDTEKEKYELKEITPQSFAYAIKPNARGAEPDHLLCTNCYEHRKKSILQKADAAHLKCPNCSALIRFKEFTPTPSSGGATWGASRRG